MYQQAKPSRENPCFGKYCYAHGATGVFVKFGHAVADMKCAKAVDSIAHRSSWACASVCFENRHSSRKKMCPNLLSIPIWIFILFHVYHVFIYNCYWGPKNQNTALRRSIFSYVCIYIQSCCFRSFNSVVSSFVVEDTCRKQCLLMPHDDILLETPEKISSLFFGVALKFCSNAVPKPDVMRRSIRQRVMTVTSKILSPCNFDGTRPEIADGIRIFLRAHNMMRPIFFVSVW